MWNIIFLGMISFFSDVSSEMAYPLIPLYLTGTLGATPAFVGMIEGIAESLASLLKVFSGYITDRYRSKKPIAFLGYTTGILYKVILILSASWAGVLAARCIDRIGKGIRTVPRDVLVSENAVRGKEGRAFGLHKMLDMAGSALGILFAYLLLSNGQTAYKKVFMLSVIPALIGLFLFLFVREKKEPRELKSREPFWKNWKQLDARLKLYLVIVFIFTLGNSSNTFLLLRAKSVGFNDTNVILLYFIYNLTASLLAFWAGKKSDIVGRRKVLTAGYLTFSLVYIGFAFAFNKPFIILMFVLYGAYTAMITGVERAFITEISPVAVKGTMLGLHSMLIGIALFPASMIAGVLWTAAGARAPFFYGAGMSLLAAMLLVFFWKDSKRKTAEVL